MTPKTKIFLIIVLGIVLVVITILFGLKPLLANVRSLGGEMQKKHAELDQINNQLREFATAKSDLAKATFKDDIYNTIVIREDLSIAIKELEEAAAITDTEESLQIEDDDTKSKAPGRTPKSAAKQLILNGLTSTNEINYGITVENDFNKLITFLQYLENLPHLTELHRINLNAVSANDGGTNPQNSSVVTGTIEGVFFVKKSAEVAEVPAEE